MTPQSPYKAPQPPPASDSQGITLWAFVLNAWAERYLLLACVLGFMALGAVFVWRSSPVYKSDALLQIQAKKVGAADASFTKMEKLFPEPMDAQAEVEILKSSLVLGRTVEALKLDTTIHPVLLPIFGKALMRGRSDAPVAKVDSFDLSPSLRGQPFTLTLLQDGSFIWTGPDGKFLERGKPGELLSASAYGQTLTLRIQELTGKPGQKFILLRKSTPDAINDLRIDFDAFERGKMTNVLGLSYSASSPENAAGILNEIVDQYVRHKIEGKNAEVNRTLALLNEKMPVLKAHLDEAETRLNQFRIRSGSVDLSREADVFLQQSSSLNAQITGLKQKKEELLRTYQEASDVVETLNQQIHKLQAEASQVDSKMRILPRTQQEVVRLSRDVQVSTDLYTAMMNNIQQLQVARASDNGNVSVVDRATPNFDPVAPKKGTLMGVFTLLGLMVGLGIITMRQSSLHGIEDHRLIESNLNLPVVVTIPHSKAQEDRTEAIEDNAGGIQLLGLLAPNDLAMESLRSLRTMLRFSLKDAPNGVIMITGPSPLIGKSFISSNLAVVLAQGGSKVLVLDADLRRGNLYQYFGLNDRLEGLSEVLAGRLEWRKAVHKTEVPGLEVVKSGVIPSNPSELLMQVRFAKLIAEASAEYDYIIIDAPPLLPVTDATIIGTLAGTSFLVVKYGEHSLDEIRACQQRMSAHGISLRGCIFNDVELKGLGNNHQFAKYAYHYEYKKE